MEKEELAVGNAFTSCSCEGTGLLGRRVFGDDRPIKGSAQILSTVQTGSLPVGQRS